MRYIKKKDLTLYSESLLRYCYLYCVEMKLLDKNTDFDSWVQEVHKYMKYSRSEYFEKMSFDEFKKGYDIA